MTISLHHHCSSDIEITVRLLQSVAGAVIPLYVQLIEKHKEDNYTYNDRSDLAFIGQFN